MRRSHRDSPSQSESTSYGSSHYPHRSVWPERQHLHPPWVGGGHWSRWRGQATLAAGEYLHPCVAWQSPRSHPPTRPRGELIPRPASVPNSRKRPQSLARFSLSKMIKRVLRCVTTSRKSRTQSRHPISIHSPLPLRVLPKPVRHSARQVRPPRAASLPLWRFHYLS